MGESLVLEKVCYHVDNGRFTDNAFVNNLNQQGQIINYFGANAYHQNGEVIIDLKKKTRIILLHATHQSPEIIIPHLWPYALQMANQIVNITSRRQDGSIPMAFLQVKSGAANRPPTSIWLPSMSVGLTTATKKEDRQVATEKHVRTVHLVLFINTVLVSPQYHVHLDNFFETKNLESNTGKPSLQLTLIQYLTIGLRVGILTSISGR